MAEKSKEIHACFIWRSGEVVGRSDWLAVKIRMNGGSGGMGILIESSNIFYKR